MRDRRSIGLLSIVLAAGVILLGGAPALAFQPDLVQVPEPGSLVLLSVGAAALAWRLRKRR